MSSLVDAIAGLIDVKIAVAIEQLKREMAAQKCMNAIQEELDNKVSYTDRINKVLSEGVTEDGQ